MKLPHWPGWRLIGRYPEGDDDGVGAWLLYNHGGRSIGEAMLLECPPGLKVDHVYKALRDVKCNLTYVGYSHDHYDHLCPRVYRKLLEEWKGRAYFLDNSRTNHSCIDLAGELLYRIFAPKHSHWDVVHVFRGVAHTGDIELGMLDSVNREVTPKVKRRSMGYLKTFPQRTGYHVHTTISAHLNDLRENVDWPSLFSYPEEALVY